MDNVVIRRIQDSDSSGLSLHGLNYPLRFDSDGLCVVSRVDYETWVVPSAAAQGVFYVSDTKDEPSHLAARTKARVGLAGGASAHSEHVGGGWFEGVDRAGRPFKVKGKDKAKELVGG